MTEESMQDTPSAIRAERPALLRRIFQHLQWDWALIKDLQTLLLLLTGVAGYVSGGYGGTHSLLPSLMGSLFLAISGATVLNMVYDRDIDARMPRTANRPLPSGKIGVAEGVILGAALSTGGVGWSFALSPLYGMVVFAGLFFDVVIYTIWLKRRTPFSIVIGGLSGGMPALAGRALATGQIDLIGGLLALGVLLWIPTHIMTFNIKRARDYELAAIPTFPAAYGVPVTRVIIATSTLLAVAVMLWAGHLVGLGIASLASLAVVGGVLIALLGISLFKPGRLPEVILYKGASIYMLIAMLLFIFGGF